MVHHSDTLWKEETLASLEVRDAPTGASEKISLVGAKAIFFVKSFAGRASHHELHFHDEVGPPGRLYVRLTFLDNEIMEGMVENTRNLLVNAGFFLEAIDPDSNNVQIYVFKAQIKDFRILAVRKDATSDSSAKPNRLSKRT